MKYILTTRTGKWVSLIELGATIQDVRIPDAAGNTASVMLGYDDLDSYLNAPFILGSTVGPVDNRIANAEFSLDGVRYLLEPNYLGKHHLLPLPFWLVFYGISVGKKYFTMLIPKSVNTDGHEGCFLILNSKEACPFKYLNLPSQSVNCFVLLLMR